MRKKLSVALVGSAVAILCCETWAGVYATPVVSLIGAFFLSGLIYGNTASRHRKALKAAHPHEPWLWRRDWAFGAIPDHAAKKALGAWLLAIAVNGIALPVGFIAARNAIVRHNYAALFALIFPAIGLALLIAAIRTTRRGLKFGMSYLRLKEVPALTGKQLAGTIHGTRVGQWEAGVKLRLACINEVTTGSGKSTSTIQDTIWENEQTLDHLPDAGNGAEIPVLFVIPADAHSVDALNPGNVWRWQLEVKAKTRGISYYARFDVPVFAEARAAAVTPQSACIASPAPHRIIPARHGTQLKRVACQPLPDGGLRIRFPAGSRSLAVGLTVVGLAFTGVAIGFAMMPKTSVSDWLETFLFAVPFGLIGVSFDLFALIPWFCSSSITIRSGSMSFEKSTPLLGPSVSLQRNEITDLVCEQCGSTLGKACFALQLKTRDGKTRRLVDYIDDQGDAEWLGEQIRKALGLPDTTAPGMAVSST